MLRTSTTWSRSASAARIFPRSPGTVVRSPRSWSAIRCNLSASGELSGMSVVSLSFICTILCFDAAPGALARQVPLVPSRVLTGDDPRPARSPVVVPVLRQGQGYLVLLDQRNAADGVRPLGKLVVERGCEHKNDHGLT